MLCIGYENLFCNESITEFIKSYEYKTIAAQRYAVQVMRRNRDAISSFACNQKITQIFIRINLM